MDYVYAWYLMRPERGVYPLELKSQTIVSHPVWLFGILVLWKNSACS